MRRSQTGVHAVDIASVCEHAVSKASRRLRDRDEVDAAVAAGRPLLAAEVLVRAAEARWSAAVDAALEAREDLERALELAREAADVAADEPVMEVAW